MLNTQTQAKAPGYDGTTDPNQYIFVSGDKVIGRLGADCCVCAWNEGSKRWPGTEMGMLWSFQEMADLPEMCLLLLNRMKKNYEQ